MMLETPLFGQVLELLGCELCTQKCAISTSKCVLSHCLQFQHTTQCAKRECAVFNIDICATLTHEVVTFNVLFTVVL